MSVVLSGLFGVLKSSKHVSKSILLRDIIQKYKVACDKRRREQALVQRTGEFTACYEDMNDIFVDQEKRLTDKNMKKLTRFHQNLPEKQQKKVQGKYEQIKEDVQYFKDTQTEGVCCSSFSDTIPSSTSEQERGEQQQSVTYERYEMLLQQTINIQNPTEKETALNYLEGVKEWLGQQQ